MAFVATADNPSAIFYNPAGIAQLPGNNLRGGVYGIYLDPSFVSSTTGKTYDNQDKYHAVPQLYFTHAFDAYPITFGLGVYSPFGLGITWPEDTGFRTVGLQAKMSVTTINPVLAWKPVSWFSIGGGMTINYADVILEQGLFSPDQPTDLFRFHGSGWNVGYNVGVLVQPIDKISFGVNFRSPMKIDLRGHTVAENSAGPEPSFDQRTEADGQFPFPMKVVCGASFRPTPKWNFEFDADYTDWNELNTVTLHQPGAAVLPANLPIVFNWQSSWYYEFGATRYFDNQWHVSAGYIYNENSDPNAHYTPLTADMNRDFISFGLGRKGQRIDFDVAYEFGFGPTHTVTGSAASAAGQTADGKYNYTSHAIALSAQLHF